jgi:hypothetical protein
MKLFLISNLYIIGLFLIPFLNKLFIIQIYKLNKKKPYYKIYQNFFPSFLFFIIVIFVINKNPIFANNRLIFIMFLFVFFLFSFKKIFNIFLNQYNYIKRRFNFNLIYIFNGIISLNFILIFINNKNIGFSTFIILLFFYFRAMSKFFKNINS